MTIKTPPMGWNTWNTFGEHVNEALIKETADTICEKHLDELGYKYIIIDDCWAERQRDENGNLQADHNKFPDGIKAVADYVHAKGLKFGMYSSSGFMTCAGYPASFNYEFQDAKRFAEWGVDYLKYDYCFLPKDVFSKLTYRKMSNALANCGRDILFSACTWGADGTPEWIKTTSAEMWRNTGDISDSWESIKTLLLQRDKAYLTHSINCFADMDMLIVGMNGSGNVGLANGCTIDEYKTHFNAWCFFSSPLIIGADIRKLSPEAEEILTNKKLIEIDQDSACRQPFDITPINVNPDLRMYAKLLDNGDIAVLEVNYGEADAYSWYGLPSLSLDEKYTDVIAEDLWSGEITKPHNSVFGTVLKKHCSKISRLKVRLK